MDPVTALAVAGNVLQFVQFGVDTIAKVREIYNNGQTNVHEQTKGWVLDLADYSQKLQQDLRSPAVLTCLTEDEAEFVAVCEGCIKLTASMTAALEEMKVDKKKNHRWFRSAKSGVVSIWKAEEMAAHEAQLTKYRESMNSHVLKSLSKRLDAVSIQQSTRFDQLDVTNQQILASLLDTRSAVDGDLQSQTIASADLLNRVNVVDTDPHNKQRRVIVNIYSQGERFADLKVEERDIRSRVQQQVLASLKFPGMRDRLEDVVEAHENTFKWIFEPPEKCEQYDQGKRWSDFKSWLESGNGLYWINGKAGSGKSTLMKYIHTSGRANSHLLKWSPYSKLFTAGFFFWNSGTRLQKSQAGLLRSLLHDILEQNPNLIAKILPRQWTEKYSAACRAAAAPVDSWLESTLKLAFQSLASQSSLSMKICLFIDGLDEYVGNDADIAALMSIAASGKNIKICASSRPHQAFYEEFKYHSGLRVQDLTFPDICTYVDDNLTNHTRMQRLLLQDPTAGRKLISDISTSSDGVFIWVTLAIKSLLSGLRNQDDIDLLTKRLFELPTDLDELYEHMIFKVDKVYEAERSKLFQLIACATADNPEIWDPEAGGLNVLTACFGVAKDAIPLAITELDRFWSKKKLQDQCQRTEVVIRSRCGGLLEVQYTPSDGLKTFETEIEPTMRVEYLHRTVKDFLQLWDTRMRLSDLTGGRKKDTFNPNLSLCIAYILTFKLRLIEDSSQMWEWINRVISFAQRAEADNETRIVGTDYVEVLDAFFNSASKWWATDQSNPFFEDQVSMATLAAQCGLHQYLRLKFADIDINTVRDGGKSLLYYAVVSQYFGPFALNLMVVKTLLELGADPNRQDGKWTTWQHILSYIYVRLPENKDSIITSQWITVLNDLLLYGADLKAHIFEPPKYRIIRTKRVVDKEGWSVEEVFTEAFKPQGANVLLRLRTAQKSMQKLPT